MQEAVKLYKTQGKKSRISYRNFYQVTLEFTNEPLSLDVCDEQYQ